MEWWHFCARFFYHHRNNFLTFLLFKSSPGHTSTHSRTWPQWFSDTAPRPRPPGDPTSRKPWKQSMCTGWSQPRQMLIFVGKSRCSQLLLVLQAAVLLVCLEMVETSHESLEGAGGDHVPGPTAHVWAKDWAKLAQKETKNAPKLCRLDPFFVASPVEWMTQIKVGIFVKAGEELGEPPHVYEGVIIRLEQRKED